MAETHSTSKTFFHAAHFMMYATMFTMIAQNLASMAVTGVPIGLLDPVGMLANMHIPSVEGIAALGEAGGALMDAAANGTWVTDSFFIDPHAAIGHAGHGAAAVATEPVLTDSAREILGM